MYRDRLSLLSFLSVIVLSATSLAFLGNIFSAGLPHLTWSFLTEEPLRSGREGGIAPILVSTFLIVGLASVLAFPICVASAIALTDRDFLPASLQIRISNFIDLLASVPSIVFGLFGNIFFCQILGLSFSIVSGALTLACMAIPIMIKVAEEGLRAIPNDIKLGAEALGLSKFTAFIRILFPIAAPAFAMAIILGLGRAMAETAALLFTSGYVDRYPESLWDSGRTLSVHIYDLAMNIPGGDDAAYGSSTILVIGILLINIIFSMIARNWKVRSL